MVPLFTRVNPVNVNVATAPTIDGVPPEAPHVEPPSVLDNHVTVGNKSPVTVAVNVVPPPLATLRAVCPAVIPGAIPATVNVASADVTSAPASLCATA